MLDVQCLRPRPWADGAMNGRAHSALRPAQGAPADRAETLGAAVVHSCALNPVDVVPVSRPAARMRRFELTTDDGLLLERYLAHAAAVDGYAATTIVQRKVGGSRRRRQIGSAEVSRP